MLRNQPNTSPPSLLVNAARPSPVTRRASRTRRSFEPVNLRLHFQLAAQLREVAPQLTDFAGALGPLAPRNAAAQLSTVAPCAAIF